MSVHLGTFFQFSDKVTGVTPTTVGWTVALPAGATGSPGTISAGGPLHSAGGDSESGDCDRDGDQHGRADGFGQLLR